MVQAISTTLKQDKNLFPPVVAVLGHVDHGKTTLLDSIRKTTVASREHGGITQSIGASMVTIDHEGKKRTITFIDTPGHEAFSQMRSRGAQAADIGLLIVSAVDGVKPQTKESIDLLKSAGIPFIVVLTKSDDPNKNVERVKQELLKEEIMLEGYGGDVPVIEVSAKTGTNVKELLELILLVMELHGGHKADILESAPVKAIVIESKLDQRSGPRATVIIKNGTLKTRDEIEAEGIIGKIRTLFDDTGVQKDRATIGEAVEIMGFEKVPPVGSIVTRKGEAAVKVSVPAPVEEAGEPQEVVPFDMFAEEAQDTLPLVVITDTQGSLEAITLAFPEKAKVLLAKTGDITPADVLFAKSVKALVLGFNIKLKPEIQRLASVEKVPVKNYTIIYEMLDEVRDVLEGKRLALVEEELGKAKIIAEFPFDKKIVLGITILEGRVAKGDKIRLLRGDQIVGETTIASLRQGKNQISKVEAGNEAGIILTTQLDFTIGDMVLCHN